MRREICSGKFADFGVRYFRRWPAPARGPRTKLPENSKQTFTSMYISKMFVFPSCGGIGSLSHMKDSD
jgi:hypothetical protein